jgi:ABC-type branched-subunit amino acid transport system substrate-binding protein/DNA-binding beta-propeller fold protein YncE
VHDKLDRSRSEDQQVSAKHLIVLVEESNNSVGFFDSEDASESFRIGVSLWPHEVAISPNGATAYVSNFGLRDYDLTIGHAGNSISVIDIAARCETHRLYTCEGNFRYWAPHGVKVTPDGRHLFANVERILGKREPDLTLGPGTDQTDMLVFNLETRRPVRAFSLPVVSSRVASSTEDPAKQYGVPRGSHNFVFSKDGSALWLFSGRGGISRLNPTTGEITAHLTDFAGAVRGLSFFADGRLLVSATNELTIVDPVSLKTLWRMGDLGVSQLLYAQPSPDGKVILAPAVWEGQVLAVDVERKKILKSLTTGIDPVHIITTPNQEAAYVTHGRSKWAAEVSYDTLEIVRLIPTRGGPNGVAVAPWQPRQKKDRVVFGACLPFTGQFAVEGRELRLGLEFWQDKVNDSGGILIGDRASIVDILYEDSKSSVDDVNIIEGARRLIAAGARCLFGSYPNDTFNGLAKVAEATNTPLIAAHGTLDATVLSSLLPLNGSFVIGPTRTLAAIAPIRAIANRVSPKPRTLLLICSNIDESRRAATDTERYLPSVGLVVVQIPSGQSGGGAAISGHAKGHFVIGIDGSVNDCISIASQQNPDIVMHLGTRADALALLEGVAKSASVPGALVFDCGVNNSNFMASAGELLENVIGVVGWSGAIQNCGHDRFTCAEDFARNYFGEYSEKASTFAAGAAACGVIFQNALTAAKTIRPAEVISAIKGMNASTFFGDVSFDDRHSNRLEQWVAIQIQKIEKELKEIALWPSSAQQPRQRMIWPFRP